MKKEEKPAGWRITRLGEYVEKQKGKKPGRLSDKQSEEYALPYVDIMAFEQNIVRQFTDGRGCVICEDDDFLIVWDGSRSGLVGKAIKGALGSTLVRVNFPSVNNNYAYYFLKSKYLEINSRAKGSGTPHVDPDLLWNYVFPIPPLPEQHRIVEKIEELFSELDNGIANLKEAKEQLKVYRQSVLKWAFDGRLTNAVVEDGELPEGWKWVMLKDVCQKIQDGSHFSPKTQYNEVREGTYMYITAKNIRNNYIDLKGITYVDEVFHNSIYPRCNPEYGDVLLTKDGVNTGDVTINTLNIPFSLLSSVCLIKTKHEDLHPSYLLYFIQSPVGNRNIIGEMTGTAIKRIILKNIKESLIIIPPVKQQEQIVNEIESRFSLAENMERSIDESIEQAEALRQSILKSAFEGRLVAP